MGAMNCCMYTISQLGEGELDIAAGTLTEKGESAKTITDSKGRTYFCTLWHVFTGKVKM